jgi:hypothetical protein
MTFNTDTRFMEDGGEERGKRNEIQRVWESGERGSRNQGTY